MSHVRRGEVYWLDWEPSRGVEMRGRRPGLVVQNDLGNQHSPATVVAAISSAPVKARYPFVVFLEPGEGGLPKASFVNCSQLLTIDKKRLLQKMGVLDPDRMAEVGKALVYQLALQP